jgi:putative transcriptional regulator
LYRVWPLQFSTTEEVNVANRELNNNIRRMRFENGEMTRQELADRVGVTRQTIIAIEAGKYAPSLPLAFRIARTFGVSIEQVFQFEQKSD